MLAAIVAYFTELNNRRDRLANASKKFRNVFYDEFKGLYPIPSNWPKETNALDFRLRKAFPTLQAAVDEFRHFVPWYNRKCFDKAWRIYRIGKNGREIDQQDYHQYEPHISTFNLKGKQVTIDNTKSYQDNFKRNVENLLKYAKNK